MDRIQAIQSGLVSPIYLPQLSMATAGARETGGVNEVAGTAAQEPAQRINPSGTRVQEMAPPERGGTGAEANRGNAQTPPTAVRAAGRLTGTGRAVDYLV